MFRFFASLFRTRQPRIASRIIADVIASTYPDKIVKREWTGR